MSVAERNERASAAAAREVSDDGAGGRADGARGGMGGQARGGSDRAGPAWVAESDGVRRDTGRKGWGREDQRSQEWHGRRWSERISQMRGETDWAGATWRA